MEQLTQSSKSFITVKVGTGFYHLSEREKLLVDTYLKTRSFTECSKVFESRYKRTIAASTVKRWISTRAHIQRYMEEYFENSAEAGITHEQYVAKIRKLAENDVPVQKTTPFFWKLLGDAKGFLKKEDDKQQSNIQINFVQGNGEE